MYTFLIFIVACLLGWVLWRRLGRTNMAFLLRVMLTSLFVVVVFILLFWLSISVALFLAR